MPLETHPLSHRPTIKELGLDLLLLSKGQLILAIITPLVFFALYFVAAFAGYWPVAIFSTMALSFTTYGSTSHDLVHENLKLNKTLNAAFLSIIEVICFRSGHAYKLSHLHHHKRYPHEDDVEGAAARMSLFRTMIEGVIFQFKIYFWAILNCRGHKYYSLVLLEGFVATALTILCLYSLEFTIVFFVYMCLMIAGSWTIPLVTSYAVHSPDGKDELRQTRLFRGKFFSLIAFDHLYHLEHHLYPMVPHKNWKKLAGRLDAYFESQGIKPMEVKL